jgi:hypothetical protein
LIRLSLPHIRSGWKWMPLPRRPIRSARSRRPTSQACRGAGLTGRPVSPQAGHGPRWGRARASRPSTGRVAPPATGKTVHRK